MQHPVTPETRLVSPATRLFRRFFKRQDPHGWADYHCVEEPDGRLWIHCHVPPRSPLPNLEFVGVPPEMRGYAHQLMFEIIAHGRARGGLGANMDIEGIFSAPLQNFRQMATLRWTEHEDAEHFGTLRIVDWDQPLESGFPHRLFASHIAAWAEFAHEPPQKEAMCRRALAIFPGYFLEMTAGIDIKPGKADLTDLQFRANLPAYISLAHALFDQGRAKEGIDYLQEAIARCPGWACVYRDHLLKAYRSRDRYIDFWREADIAEICAAKRPANSMGPLPVPGAKKPATRKRAAKAKLKPAATRAKKTA